MNNTSAWKNFKSTIAAPIDPWLFFAMLAIYIMSLFLLYSADGQEFGQLENKTIHTVLGFALLWIIAVFKPQQFSDGLETDLTQTEKTDKHQPITSIFQSAYGLTPTNPAPQPEVHHE